MAQTRRNVLLRGISAQALNDLVGQHFWVGSIQCRGVELCTPCPRPSQLSQQDGFQEAFEGRGGLRAEVLLGGELAIGDALRCVRPDGTATY
jgi:MOSC domain-containing protein YiiM